MNIQVAVTTTMIIISHSTQRLMRMATGGESFAMQYQRVSHFLDELKAKPYQRVAVFAHGGVLICAQIYAGVIKPEEAFDALTPYGGIIRITL